MHKLNSDVALLFFCLILLGLVLGLPLVDHRIQQLPNEKQIDMDDQQNLPVALLDQASLFVNDLPQSKSQF